MSVSQRESSMKIAIPSNLLIGNSVRFKSVKYFLNKFNKISNVFSVEQLEVN